MGEKVPECIDKTFLGQKYEVLPPASDRTCSDGQIVSLSTKGGVYTRIEKANSYWFLFEGGCQIISR